MNPVSPSPQIKNETEKAKSQSQNGDFFPQLLFDCLKPFGNTKEMRIIFAFCKTKRKEITIYRLQRITRLDKKTIKPILEEFRNQKIVELGETEKPTYRLTPYYYDKFSPVCELFSHL